MKKNASMNKTLKNLLLILCLLGTSSLFGFRSSSYKKCNIANNQCEQAGQGQVCGEDSDCGIKRCNTTTGNCEMGGNGRACDNPLQCGFKSCLAGVCTPGASESFGVGCTDDNDCQVRRCTTYGGCMLGGNKEPCTADANCTSTRCNSNGSCQSDYIGSACNDDNDCFVPNPNPRRCTALNTCAVSNDSTLIACNSNTDCSYKTCKGNGTCNFAGTSGGSKICTAASDCTSTRCNGPICQAGAGTASCTGDSNCEHKMCGANRDCVAVGWPGNDKCNDDGDCPARSTSSVPKTETSAETDLRSLGIDPESLSKAKETYLLVSPLLKTASFVGDPQAKITVMAFQDLRCGMCKRAHLEFFSKLKKDYIDTKRVKIAFIEYPLIKKPDEMELANAALCAAEQNKYLPYLEKIYMNYKSASAKTTVSFAKGVVSNLKNFKACVDSKKHYKVIENNRQIGSNAKIRGTPTYLVNGMKAQGAYCYQGIRKLIALAEESKQQIRTNAKPKLLGWRLQ